LKRRKRKEAVGEIVPLGLAHWDPNEAIYTTADHVDFKFGHFGRR
jgi:hypothetical protein